MRKNFNNAIANNAKAAKAAAAFIWNKRTEVLA